MTTTTVKGVSPLMDYVPPKQAGNMPWELTGNFTNAFSKATGQQNMMLQKDSGKESPQTKVNNTDKKGLDDRNVSIKDNSNIQSSSRAKDAKANEKAPKEMEKAGEELVSEVAKELGATEEEVISAMEMLGLTMADLLNIDNMTQLVLAIENADMLSLMTDGELYDSLQNLLGIVTQQLDQIGEITGLSPEELAAIMEKLNQPLEEQLGMDVKPDGEAKKEVTLPEGQEDYTVTVERNGEVMRVSVEVDGNAKAENEQITNTEVQAPEEEAIRTTKKDEGAKQETSSHNRDNGADFLLENLLNREMVTQTDTAFETAMTGRTIDTQDIMNQIMNYMRIQVKADMTQMQLQLHPASLGTVNINIASKEGVITAQFLTQNETVKAVIESQIVQLRNNFEEQGIKVEAVEVTVESHAFERNLSGEGNSRQQSQEGKKKGGRKLNLNEISPEETVMDEAEQLAVAMMTAGGNTVDFTA